ncbi:alpha tubulin suppressor [Cladophialophora chaetospira]|uniref:Alpha tubulin suppressor n=1 Tax=Cladophialophora chaetospira TaxID=386627 RepID=A0AA39CGH1_9EURO|nr:alpha tubulin suppressor [Cladophialophora chaetospira]
MPSPTATSLPILYALGSNSSRQLGIGHTNDVNTPEKCIFQPDERNVRPGADSEAVNGGKIVETLKKVVASGNHTLVLTDLGRLFLAGNNQKNERGEEVEAYAVFKEITHDIMHGPRLSKQPGKVITDVAATWDAFCVVMDGQFLHRYTTSPAHGLLGKYFVFQGLYCWGDKKIITIEASMGHVLMTLSNDEVHGWGACRKGQLSERYKVQKNLNSPNMLDLRSEDSTLSFAPEKIVLGREYTVFLKTGEKPVVWGEKKMFKKNDFDWRLGHDDTAVSGWSSVHVLWRKSSLGSVASIGKNNHGQFAPTGLPPVRKLAAGSEHCVALTAEGQVIAWGWGEHGNCGEKIDEKGNVRERWNVISMPQLEEGVVVKDVAAGCATTFVICGREED